MAFGKTFGKSPAQGDDHSDGASYDTATNTFRKKSKKIVQKKKPASPPKDGRPAFGSPMGKQNTGQSSASSGPDGTYMGS